MAGRRTSGASLFFRTRRRWSTNRTADSIPKPSTRRRVIASGGRSGQVCLGDRLGRHSPRLLKPETIAKIEPSEPPVYLAADRKDHHYGLGWVIVTGKRKYSGFTMACCPEPGQTPPIRFPDGVCVAAMFNGQPAEDGNFHAELGQTLLRATEEVKSWPKS